MNSPGSWNICLSGNCVRLCLFLWSGLIALWSSIMLLVNFFVLVFVCSILQQLIFGALAASLLKYWQGSHCFRVKVLFINWIWLPTFLGRHHQKPFLVYDSFLFPSLLSQSVVTFPFHVVGGNLYWIKMQVRNDKARKYLTEMRKKQPVPFAQKFPNVDPLALRLLQRLLAFDPKDRLTAEEVCSLSYLLI